MAGLLPHQIRDLLIRKGIMEKESQTILEVTQLSKSFGGVRAVDQVSLSVNNGTILGLVGPNGAGKTTLFNCLSGFHEPDQGSIRIDGNPLGSFKPLRAFEMGISRTFQNIALIPTLNVLDNMLLGAHRPLKQSLLWTLFFKSRSIRLQKEYLEKALWLAHEFQVFDYIDSPVHKLPTGILKKIEIARALLTEPKILLLDEPASGLTTEEVVVMKENVLKVLDQFKVPMIIIEHNMKFVSSLSHEMVVLNAGQVLAHGTPDKVQSDPNVIEAYLGKGLDIAEPKKSVS